MEKKRRAYSQTFKKLKGVANRLVIKLKIPQIMNRQYNTDDSVVVVSKDPQVEMYF